MQGTTTRRGVRTGAYQSHGECVGACVSLRGFRDAIYHARFLLIVVSAVALDSQSRQRLSREKWAEFELPEWRERELAIRHRGAPGNVVLVQATAHGVLS